MYSVHGEFDLLATRTYYTDVLPVNTTGEDNTYRKLYFEFTFRRKWQFYGQNLVCGGYVGRILRVNVYRN